ncbi:MAG TPA: hypothetical protein VMU59_13020 [Caulobacteraceae bacterium]|nr:hypothetical protein [Caulobacteraceae bacterium]
MIQETTRLSRGARMRRASPGWLLPVAGTIGLLAALVVAILHH